MNFPILHEKEIIIIALSGGKDSSCLLHMALEFYKKNIILPVIINHNLRENSYKEALEIQNYWKKYNINVYIINWQKPISNQTKAREFRLLNLSFFAIKNKSNIVFLGHNYEDKIETYLMRINKSTSWGLASISSKTTIYGVNFLRPLLFTSIKYIKNYIATNNIKIFEDYTNNTNKYTRNAIRNEKMKNLCLKDIREKIVFYVEERKKYEKLIYLWIKVHLIIIDRFNYKFSWNRLPLCKKLSSLILTHIGETIRGRRIDSHERFLPYLEKKMNFHVNDCQFIHRGDFTYVREILPKNINNIILKSEGVWHYKFLIVDLYGYKEFIFYLKKLPIFIFNKEEVNLASEDFLSKDGFLIKYIGRNFYSQFN